MFLPLRRNDCSICSETSTRSVLFPRNVFSSAITRAFANNRASPPEIRFFNLIRCDFTHAPELGFVQSIAETDILKCSFMNIDQKVAVFARIRFTNTLTRVAYVYNVNVYGFIFRKLIAFHLENFVQVFCTVPLENGRWKKWFSIEFHTGFSVFEQIYSTKSESVVVGSGLAVKSHGRGFPFATTGFRARFGFCIFGGRGGAFLLHHDAEYTQTEQKRKTHTRKCNDDDHGAVSEELFLGNFFLFPPFRFQKLNAIGSEV
jgi:hypothetical protein